MSSRASNSSFMDRPPHRAADEPAPLCRVGFVPQLSDEKTQGMQRLAQVVARRGQEVRLVLVAISSCWVLSWITSLSCASRSSACSA